MKISDYWVEYMLLLLCILLSLLVIFNKYYVPNGTIIIRNHFDYRYLDEYASKLYLVKTPVVEEIMTFCGEFNSHWAIMIKTTGNHYFVFSSSRTGNVYVYYIHDNNIVWKNGKTYIGYNKIIPKWILCDGFNPASHFTKVKDILNFMSDYVSEMVYHLFSYNCHFVATYCIERFCIGNVPTPIKHGKLRNRLIREFILGESIM